MYRAQFQSNKQNLLWIIILSFTLYILFVSAKIRRLYDIANILTSLGLIKKIHVTEYRGRKPAFQYIGPDVDDIEDVGSQFIFYYYLC